MLQICQELDKKGITPSVAMLRAKSVNAVTVPQAISAIQKYKAGIRASVNDMPTLAEEAEETLSANIEQRLQNLENENRVLKQQVSDIVEQLRIMGNS